MIIERQNEYGSYVLCAQQKLASLTSKYVSNEPNKDWCSRGVVTRLGILISIHLIAIILSF